MSDLKTKLQGGQEQFQIKLNKNNTEENSKRTKRMKMR